MSRTIDPRRRCLKVEEWPERERRVWLTLRTPKGRGRISGRGPAAHLAAAAFEKYQEGYGRFLGYLAWRGGLDPAAAPEQRVTPEVMESYVDHLLAMGNAGNTIYGRLQELTEALRFLAPQADFAWLLNPGGTSIRHRLDMTRRSFTVHHPRTLYRWGFDLMRKALTLTGHRRRQVMLRDGLMIALLAARAMRLRAAEALSLDAKVRWDGERWQILLAPEDMKTRRALEYPAPRGLDAWINRYATVERVELLAGQICDAFWVNWGGKPLCAAGIEKRIRRWSAKKFGPKGAFGPHRFRYGIATVAPVADPAAPANGAVLLGITAETFRESYDRGERETVARNFLEGLDAERKATRGYAERIFEHHFGPVVDASPHPAKTISK